MLLRRFRPLVLRGEESRRDGYLTFLRLLLLLRHRGLRRGHGHSRALTLFIVRILLRSLFQRRDGCGEGLEGLEGPGGLGGLDDMCLTGELFSDEEDCSSSEDDGESSEESEEETGASETRSRRRRHRHACDGDCEGDEDPSAETQDSVTSAAKVGVLAQPFDFHGKFTHLYHNYRRGWFANPDILNGFAETINERDYDRLSLGGHLSRTLFTHNHFLFTIQSKTNHPLRDRNLADYATAANLISGRTLFLQRGIRYHLTFLIPDPDCNCNLGEGFDSSAAEAECFMLTDDPSGGAGSAPYSWFGDPMRPGESRWIQVPAFAPEIGFYQLTGTAFAGAGIRFYGGERYHY